MWERELNWNWLLPKRLQSGGFVDDLMILTLVAVLGGSGYLAYDWWNKGDDCRQKELAPKVVMVTCPTVAISE